MKYSCRLLILLTMLSSASSWAEWSPFETGELDSRTDRTQAKVETLYKRGDYKRAHFIYSNELARLGDKYAQYMTGYMYLNGQGVAEDKVKASAWYRIAAERRVPEFMAVRDQLMRTLNDDQRAESDELYIELRQEYSDMVIIMGLLTKDLKGLKQSRTGSRLSSGNSSSVMVIDPNTGIPTPADQIRNRALRKAQARLDFLTGRLDVDTVRAEQADDQVDDLWARINEFLSVVDDETDAFVATP